MRITLVIPAHDDAPMLDRCLTDARAQSRPADEIIVVDNASTDDTAAVARRHGATVIHEPRLGIWAAAARGYDAATGDVIARCDADCRLPADWLERIERRLDERPDAVGVTGRGRFYDLAAVPRALASVLYMRAYFWSMYGALAGTAFFGSNMAIRASEWRAVRDRVHRDEREVHDDLDLSLCVPADHRVVYDRDLVTGISGRPFDDPKAMRRRIRRAWRTLALNWPAQLPWVRWWRRLAPAPPRAATAPAPPRPAAAPAPPRPAAAPAPTRDDDAASPRTTTERTGHAERNPR